MKKPELIELEAVMYMYASSKLLEGIYPEESYVKSLVNESYTNYHETYLDFDDGTLSEDELQSVRDKLIAIINESA